MLVYDQAGHESWINGMDGEYMDFEEDEEATFSLNHRGRRWFLKNGPVFHLIDGKGILVE